MAGRERKLSGKVKTWQQASGRAWAGAGIVAPLPSASQWARGRGGGKGTHQYWVHTPPGPRHRSGTRPRPPGGHLCSGGREEGGGGEEDSRAGQQAPQPPPVLWDRMGGGSWAETHTLVHTPALIACWVTQGPPPPPCKARLTEQPCPAAAPALLGINETEHVVPFISGNLGALKPDL